MKYNKKLAIGWRSLGQDNTGHRARNERAGLARPRRASRTAGRPTRSIDRVEVRAMARSFIIVVKLETRVKWRLKLELLPNSLLNEFKFLELNPPPHVCSCLLLTHRPTNELPH